MYTPTQLYRGIYCIAELAYHVNFRAQRPLVIIYVQGKCQTLISSKKMCKISRILVSKFITLQNSCRKRVFAQTGYTLPIKFLLGTSNIHCFYFLQTAICRLNVRDHVPLLGHVISLNGNSDICILGEPRDTEDTFGTSA